MKKKSVRTPWAHTRGAKGNINGGGRRKSLASPGALENGGRQGEGPYQGRSCMPGQIEVQGKCWGGTYAEKEIPRQWLQGTGIPDQSRQLQVCVERKAKSIQWTTRFGNSNLTGGKEKGEIWEKENVEEAGAACSLQKI